MKNILTTFLLLLTTILTNAMVRTLNNNNPSPGQFTTYASAEAASSMNDTIYVSGSPYSYGDITITKIVTLIGAGYNPQKQNPLTSKFGSIEGDGIVGIIKLNGIRCNTVSNNINVGTCQLNISNCYIINSVGLVAHSPFNCYLFMNNCIVDNNNGLYSIYANGTSGVLSGEIRNNIIRGTIFSFLAIQDCYIMNNLFISNPTASNNNASHLIDNSVGGPIDFQNSFFYNNIVLGFANSGLSTTSTGICSNNLLYPTSFTLPNSNGTINTNPLFLSFPCPTWNCGFGLSYDYHLSVSSPGHNAGTDGTDIGPYGGPYGASFTTYGEPNIPQIKQMNMPTSVVSGSTFNVNVISTVK